MNHDTLPSTPHNGLARPSSSLDLPKVAESRLDSQSPLLILNGPDGSELDVPLLDEKVMNGAPTSTSEADADGELIATSDSMQFSRSDSQDPSDTTEAATLQGLERATAALESIKEQERTRELSAVARARKSAAFRSPIATSVRYRSIAGTPVPNPFSPKLRDESLTVTAGSSRATSPSRTPSGRAKRRKVERSAVAVSNPSLLSIDANDRRRSARVAKATVSVPSDGTSHTPNLSQFGFSPFLENLVMGAREHDRRTRSGVRATRPVAPPTKTKRPAAATKNKTKEKDPDLDSSGLEAKKELLRQLCILSYQLQAELDMVPFKTLDQLEADLDTPPPQADTASNFRPSTTMNGTSLRPSYEVQGTFADTIKSEPQYSRSVPSGYRRPGYTPESSPEISLVDSMKVRVPAFSSYEHPSHRMDIEEYYTPASPVPRPSRSNIMSISALMDGPAPKKARYRSPTPDAPMAWTYEDDIASQILAELLAMKPKVDTTELDRLAQIVQLAAIDVELPSRAGSPDEDERKKADDPLTLNPLKTLHLQRLFDSEEVDYLEQRTACGELYASFPYLTSFDEVVDEWRAGELSRLRLELQYRRSEIERIWTCDRKLAWSNFINDRAGELYRKHAMRAHHQKWQAQMELDLLCVHRRKTRAVAKLTEQIWVPKTADGVDEKEKELYAKYGSFVYGAKHAGLDDPLVRGDLDRLRLARFTQQHDLAQEDDDVDMAISVGAIEDEVGMQEELISVDGSSESEYESDFSLSSGISSLPSFSSLSASPISFEVKDADHEETASTSVDGGSEGDSAELKQPADLDDPMTNGDTTHEVAADARPKEPLRKQSPKRKKPPPPGARLWKQGQVQHDELSTEVEEEPLQQDLSHGDPYYYQASMPTKTMSNGDESARRLAPQHEEDLRYAEHQRMLYEQQVYEYEHQRHFYAHPGFYAPRESLHENGDVQHREYYPSYHAAHHQQQQQAPPHAFAQIPAGQHRSQWPY